MPNEITDPNNPAGTYQPNQQDWDRASNDINTWKDKNAVGQNINWDAARKAYDQRASTGQGNYGDWVNSTLDQSKSWLSGGAPTTSTTTPTTPARGNFDLEAVRKAWAYGGKGHTQQVTPDELQQFMKQNQNILGGAELRGEKLFNNGKFVADMIGNYKAGDPNKMSRIFLDGIGSNGKPRVPPKTPPKTPPGKPPVTPPSTPKPPVIPTVPTIPTAPTTVPGTAPAQSIAPIRDPRLDQLYETLMGRVQQGLNVDRNNPAIRGQADAFSANQERSRRNYLADTAEQLGPTANLRNESRMTAERAGQASGQFEAELMGREIAARRDEIQQALNNSQGLLTTEQQLALQNELSRMNDATQRFGIRTGDATQRRGQDINQNQFGRDLDYRNRALNQNDEQFRDRLGFDYGDRSNYWDQINRAGGF